MAARKLLAEPRSAENKEVWNTLAAEFPSGDHAALSTEAAAAAVLASAIWLKDGNAPLWRLDDQHASKVLFNVIISRSTLSGSGKAGQRIAHPSVHHSHRWEKTIGQFAWERHEGGSSPQGLFAKLAGTVEGQPRGEAVWSCRPRRNISYGTEGTTGATRHGQLDCYPQLLQRLEPHHKDSGARGGGQLHAGAHSLMVKRYHCTRPAGVFFPVDSGETRTVEAHLHQQPYQQPSLCSQLADKLTPSTPRHPRLSITKVASVRPHSSKGTCPG